MSAWPAPATLAAAVRGSVAMVVRTPLGNVRGVPGPRPDVYYAVSRDVRAACCLGCGTAEREPDPPGSGGPGEARVALLMPGTKDHALYVLTWLNRFARAHEACPASGGDAVPA